MKRKLWLLAALLVGVPALAQAQWGISDIYDYPGSYGISAGQYLRLGADGNIYVVNLEGSNSTWGELIKLSLSWTGDIVSSSASVLHSFGDSLYGSYPSSPVVEDGQGNFFGTSTLGAGSSPYGSVWEYSATGTMSVIYQFSGGSTNTCSPNDMTLVQGAADTVTLYGEAQGCATSMTSNSGAIFKLKGLPGTAASWHLTIQHEFLGGSEGDEPSGGLTLGSDGSFYGTTHDGGTSSEGTIFSITTGGTLTTIASFPSTAGPQGYAPVGRRDAGDTVSFVGERILSGSDGLVYQIVKVGTGSFTYSTLPTFRGGTTDGANPGSPLIYSPVSGYFFGTTIAGGLHSSAGTFYSLTPSGTLSVLNSFPQASFSAPSGTLAWNNGSGCNPCAVGVGSGGGTSNDGGVWVAVAP